ncbi:MAG: response regulator, partial [Gemmatimonadetes bacterium]|nr:response regulator [Gemmatimonadota bacterium]
REFALDGGTATEQRQILRSIIEEGGWVGRVRRRRIDDRRVIPLELIMGRIDREGDEPTLLFGMIRDISDELEQERYLRRAERLASVGTLVGGAAHELNNPLHAVRSFAELMLMEPRPTEDLEALEIIKREADRAAKIVSDLRLFARQTQDDSSARSAVDLNEVVRHVVKVRRYSLETRGIAVVDELAGDIPPVRANRGEVEQVVLNLLVNAEQAMASEEGERRLLLRTALGANGVTLLVGDTGPGILPEHRDRIFDPFFTTKSPGEGTGLGLSIVHSIVTEHGGRIRVESSPSGTSFVVELPCATRAEAAEVLDPAGPPLATRDLRVLVGEEDDSARRATTRYLTRLGYHVDTATDDAELRRLLDGSDYDAVVCDLRMPGLDSESLLRLVQQQGAGLDRRLIFLTGDATGTPGLVHLAARGVPVLLKPVRLEELGREVQRVIGAVPSSSDTDE